MSSIAKFGLPLTFAALVVTFSGSAGAQTGTWSTPATLSHGFDNAAAIDGNGNSVAVWHDDIPANSTSVEQLLIKASSEPAGGSFGTATLLFQVAQAPNGICPCPIVQTTPAGFATAVWSDGFNLFAADRPSASSGWNPAQELAKGPVGQVSFVMNSHGDAAVVWWFATQTNEAVMAMRRPAGGTWSAPQTIASAALQPGIHPGPRVIALEGGAGISDNGAVVATWDAFDETCDTHAPPHCKFVNYMLHASRQEPGSSTWVDSGPLTGRDGFRHDALVALDPAGRAMLVELVEYDPQEGQLGPSILMSAIQGASGGAWSPLTTVVNVAVGSKQLGVDAAGNTTLVYNANGVFAVTSSTSSNTWSLPEAISNGGGLVQLAVASTGAAVVVWNEGTGSTGTTGQIRAVTRASPTGSFSSPVTISGPIVQTFDAASVAVNSSGDAVALYRGASVSGGPTDTVFVTNFLAP